MSKSNVKKEDAAGTKRKGGRAATVPTRVSPKRAHSLGPGSSGPHPRFPKAARAPGLPPAGGQKQIVKSTTTRSRVGKRRTRKPTQP